MNNLQIILGADASNEIIGRAHAAIDAFFGTEQRLADAYLDSAGPERNIESVAEEQATITLDSEGLPWDHRIHASTKTQTKAGIWTKARGTDEKTYNAVVAELRKVYPEAAAAPAPAAAIAAIAPIITNANVPAIAIAPKTKYQELCEYIAQHVGKGQFTQGLVDATFQKYETSLAAIAGDEERSEAFLGAFQGFVVANP